MDERLVADASPLIALGSIGRLSLLETLASDTVVPEAVAKEVMRLEDDASRAFATSSIRRVPVEPEARVLGWGLGAGETGVLSFALQNPGYTAVVDDLAARRCAAALGIPTRGTVGLVLLGKERRLLPSAREVLDALREVGLHVSAELYDQALSLAGEEPES